MAPRGADCIRSWVIRNISRIAHLRFRTDRSHVSPWEETALISHFSWSLSRTVGWGLSPSVGRAAPRWPLGWQGISDGVGVQIVSSAKPQGAQSTPDGGLHCNRHLISLPAFTLISQGCFSTCRLFSFWPSLPVSPSPHEFLVWGRFSLDDVLCRMSLCSSQAQIICQSQEVKKNVVQPQNQFPRQKIKNRDVAEWDAKVSLHLGRNHWVN